MAKNAFEFDAKDIISDDPADWIAFAEKSLKKLRYTYNASYWAAQLIRRFATFANDIYLTDEFDRAFFNLIYAPIHETAKNVKRKGDFCCDLEIQNPLFSLALLFLDEVNEGKANVPQAIINNLVLVLDVAYRLIGSKSGNVNEAKRLSAAFGDFANNCLTVPNTRYTKSQMLDAERIFLQHNRYFFDRALNPQPPQSGKGSGIKGLLDLSELLKPVFIEEEQKAALREAERKAVRRLSSDENDDESDVTDEPEAAESPSPSDADLIAKASESIATAIDNVKESEPFYNQETKIPPSEFISEQLDPERGSIVPRMRFLQNIQRPKSIAVEPFLESLQSFNQKMTAYFIAVFGCATTRNLTRLTFSAEHKWEVFNFYASHFGVSSDSDEKGSLHDKAIAKFGEFGNAMKKLGAAFAEYEHELPNKPILLLASSHAAPRTNDLTDAETPRRLNLPGSQVEKHAKYCKWILDCLEDYRRRFRETYRGELENRITKHLYLPSVEDIAAWIRKAKKDKTITRRKIENTLFHALGTTVNWYAFKRNLGRQTAQELQQLADSKRNAKRTDKTIKPATYRISKDYRRINPDIVMYWDHLATNSEFVLINHRPSSSSMFDCKKYLAALTAELQNLLKNC